MDVATVNHLKPVATELLLAHCSALESEDQRRPSAAARLEALLGSELARRLVSTLSSRAR